MRQCWLCGGVRGLAKFPRRNGPTARHGWHARALDNIDRRGFEGVSGVRVADAGGMLQLAKFLPSTVWRVTDSESRAPSGGQAHRQYVAFSAPGHEVCMRGPWAASSLSSSSSSAAMLAQGRTGLWPWPDRRSGQGHSVLWPWPDRQCHEGLNALWPWPDRQSGQGRNVPCPWPDRPGQGHNALCPWQDRRSGQGHSTLRP